MRRKFLRINDELVELVMCRYGLSSKTEAVDMALRHLVGWPMTTKEALAMRGTRSIGEVPPDGRDW